MTAVIHGFELLEERSIPEINTKARLFKHIRTGAELLSLENDDENKSFCVGFQTPPPDSTGIAHILEHSVLCGSRKYPVKDPFVQLLKTSVNTFLNAMTFDDMTIYPVASTNLKDFYNLVDVYMDAVFYPLIPPAVLQQEGWHYESDDAVSPLIYKGVVFNEMKAAYSVPERILGNVAQAALFPDTPYANEAGGDPAAIPNLTYEQFKNFHSDYYHPSNARIIFWGDDDATERLRLVNDFIAEFERKEVDSSLPLQKPFTAPRSISASYDAGEETAESKMTMLTISWLMPEITNQERMLELEVLSHALISTAASPLRKALIDSGIGEDLVGDGLDTFKRQAVFSVGLKGIYQQDAPKVENLILETLGNLAEEGIDPDTIAAALNTIEFRMRERNTGSFPRGLMTAIYSLPVWMHGGNPLDAIAFEENLQTVKNRYANDKEYFERMMGEYFLNNPHRSTVILSPDPSVAPQREAAERERLDAAKASMNADDLQIVFDIQQKLKIIQEMPDNPEDLAKIPTLTIADLDRKIKTVPQVRLEQDGAQIFFHEQATAGVLYFDLAFDLRSLPVEYLPYADLFAEVLTRMGTASEDFVTLTQRIGIKTGGINANTSLSMKRMSQTDYIAYLFVRTKTMHDKGADLLAILQDILLTVDLDNQERFKQIILARKARRERGLATNGHAIAGGRVRAHFNIADWAEEQMGGTEGLFFLRELVERVDSDWESISNALKFVRDTLVNRSKMLVNVTAEAQIWAAFQAPLNKFLAELPARDWTPQVWSMSALPTHEGLTMPLQVNFNAKGANLFELGYQPSGALNVVTKILNMDYMWQKIRVQGGAYGGRMSFSNYSGVLTFLSWRDPNIAGTLHNFDLTAPYLKSIELSADDLEKAIIGTIGDLDGYDLPDAKGFQALMRYLLGYTDEMRQANRDEVLNTTVDDFHAFGAWLEKVAEVGHTVVVGSSDALQAANQELDSRYTLTKLL